MFNITSFFHPFFIMSSHFLLVIYYSLYFPSFSTLFKTFAFTIIVFFISGNEIFKRNNHGQSVFMMTSRCDWTNHIGC